MENLLCTEKSFREAVIKKRFQVWYQPQVDMRTERPKGAEALVRWQKEDGTFLAPDRFVPVLEKLGLTALLDEEVMGIVCRDICQAKIDKISFGPVSVNFSRLHAGRAETIGRLKDITEHYGISRGEICFEITETDVEKRKEDDIRKFVGKLQDDGYRIAMDDYGIESSTLKLLQETRFDVLKLDRYFVSRIGDDRADIILSSTIAMAKRLGMEVVAEGIETEEQICFLLEHGCYLGQGYYYSEPLPKEQYISWREKYEETV